MDCRRLEQVRLPDFFVIGAQKSATTWVHRCLRDHPAVFMPPEEVTYFEDPDFGATPISELHALLSPAVEGQIIGIKRPSYLASPEVAQRILELVPDARLIAVLRNPVDRAFSAYAHYVRSGFIPAVPPDRGFVELLAGRWALRYPRSREIIDFGFYGRHLVSYLSVFDSDRLVVLLYEDIASDPVAQLRRLYDFLGVDPRFRPPSLDSVPQRGVYSLWRLRLLAGASRSLNEYDEGGRLHARRLGLRRDWLVQVIRPFVKAVLLRGQRRPTYGNPLRGALRDVYADDVRLLREQLVVPPLSWRDFVEDGSRVGSC